MQRKVLSFYKLTLLGHVDFPALRLELHSFFKEHGALGRVYVGREGLNAQVSVPVQHIGRLKSEFGFKFRAFDSVFFNVSPTPGDGAFEKLRVKVREQIVSDDMPLAGFDLSLQPTALDPADFNRELRTLDPERGIMLDIRNGYELEVGRFANTGHLIEAESYREYMRRAIEYLGSSFPKDGKILMACTGGIRCSKGGVVLRNLGYSNVKMLKGGITHYINTLPVEERLFTGKNFTFDQRCGERHADSTTVSRCSCCGQTEERMENCANSACNRLIVQCSGCGARYNGACGPGCQQIVALPDLLKLYRSVGSASGKHHRTLAF